MIRSYQPAALPPRRSGDAEGSGTTLAQRVAQRLRKDILDGRLKAGTALREIALASKLKVSRIPLREALRLLEAEGLVESSPFRGAFVAPLSIAELRQLAEIRMEMDVLAWRLALPNLSDEDLRDAAHIVDLYEKSDDLDKAQELAWQFHEHLWNAAHRPLLVGMIRWLWTMGTRYIRICIEQRFKGAPVTNYYRDMLDAIRRRDLAAIERIIRTAYPTACEAVARQIAANQTAVSPAAEELASDPSTTA